MYTHFNQHDPSITDAQDALLQERLPGKLGNIRLGDLLLDEHDKDGNAIKIPTDRLASYVRGRIFEIGDAIIPALPRKISLPDAIIEIALYSIAHDHLVFAFDESMFRYRTEDPCMIDCLDCHPVNPDSINPYKLMNIRFFRGKAYMIS
jgi:hypothetical protein